MNINTAFPSTYIKASDLEGRSVLVTIREVKVEQVGRDRDQKPVAYFEGKQKGLVLNKTNARTIANIAGSADTDDWAGVQIGIYPTETEFAGDMVECIRVKAPAQLRRRAPAPPAAEEFDSDARDARGSTAPAPVSTATRPAPAPAPAPAAARETATTITDDDIPF